MAYQAIPTSGNSGSGPTPGGAKQVAYGNAGGTAYTSAADLTYDDSTHDLLLSVSESGGTVGFSVTNSSNTAASNATIEAAVAGTTANDPFLKLTISGGTSYVLGPDNSNSDILTIMPGSAITSSAAAVRIDSNGLLAGGVANPVDLSGIPDGGGGNTAYLQSTGTHNGGTWVYAYSGANGAGARAGFVCHTSSGSNVGQFTSYNLGYGTSHFGRVSGSHVGLISQAKMLIGNTSAGHDLTFGTADTERLCITGAGNIALWGTSAAAASNVNYQSMVKGLFIGDASAEPTADAAGGSFLYSFGGVLKSRSDIGMTEAKNIILGTTTGTKIGTATTQKLGFYNATPVVRQTAGAATAGAVYTATEQTMLQTVYDAIRTLGLMS